MMLSYCIKINTVNSEIKVTIRKATIAVAYIFRSMLITVCLGRGGGQECRERG